MRPRSRSRRAATEFRRRRADAAHPREGDRRRGHHGDSFPPGRGLQARSRAPRSPDRSHDPDRRSLGRRRAARGGGGPLRPERRDAARHHRGVPAEPPGRRALPPAPRRRGHDPSRGAGTYAHRRPRRGGWLDAAAAREGVPAESGRCASGRISPSTEATRISLTSSASSDRSPGRRPPGSIAAPAIWPDVSSSPDGSRRCSVRPGLAERDLRRIRTRIP